MVYYRKTLLKEDRIRALNHYAGIITDLTANDRRDANLDIPRQATDIAKSSKWIRKIRRYYRMRTDISRIVRGAADNVRSYPHNAPITFHRIANITSGRMMQQRVICDRIITDLFSRICYQLRLVQREVVEVWRLLWDMLYKLAQANLGEKWVEPPQTLRVWGLGKKVLLATVEYEYAWNNPAKDIVVVRLPIRAPKYRYEFRLKWLRRQLAKNPLGAPGYRAIRYKVNMVTGKRAIRSKDYE